MRSVRSSQVIARVAANPTIPEINKVFDPTTRGVSEILSHFSSKSDLPIVILCTMTRNLGNALRLNKFDNQLSCTDPRFTSLVSKLVELVPSLNGSALSAVSDSLNAFPPRTTDEQEWALRPLSAAIASEFKNRAHSLSPDELSSVIRCLSFRRGLGEGDELRKLAAGQISRSEHALAYYNVRTLCQGVGEWPADSLTAETGRTLIRRLQKTVGYISAVEAVKTLTVILRAPNFIKAVPADELKRTLVAEALQAWDGYNTDTKITLAELLGSNREFLKDAKVLNGRMKALVDDLRPVDLAGFIYAVGLLRFNVDNMDKVIGKFAEKPRDQAKMSERVDVLWALCQMRLTQTAEFAQILEKAIPFANPVLKTDDTNRLAKWYDIYVSLGEQSDTQKSFPQSWITELKVFEQRRAQTELRSKYGLRIEKALTEAKGPKFHPLKFKKDVQIGDYCVPYYDDDQKIAIDLEPRSFQMSFSLRNRYFINKGISLIVVPDGGFYSNDPFAAGRLINSQILRKTQES